MKMKNKKDAPILVMNSLFTLGTLGLCIYNFITGYQFMGFLIFFFFVLSVGNVVNGYINGYNRK